MNAGLWIDHREAIIVMLTETGEETKRIQSSPDDSSVETHHADADDSREREKMGHLAHYYDQIIAHLRDAGSILIFGPGEAKGELKKQFEKHSVGTHSIALETTDKMTTPQVVALVRHHFHRDPARQ